MAACRSIAMHPGVLVWIQVFKASCATLMLEMTARNSRISSMASGPSATDTGGTMHAAPARRCVSVKSCVGHKSREMQASASASALHFAENGREQSTWLCARSLAPWVVWEVGCMCLTKHCSATCLPGHNSVAPRLREEVYPAISDHPRSGASTCEASDTASKDSSKEWDCGHLAAASRRQSPRRSPSSATLSA